MKLRTTSNSIRIRIRKSEITELREKHIIEESVRFPTGVIFKFALTISKETNEVNATLNDNYLLLSIPEKEAVEWIDSNTVGIETHLNLPNQEQLHLLIEKDFPCLDRPESPESC